MSQIGQKDIRNHADICLMYFTIVNGSEKGTIWPNPGSQKDVLYSDEKKAMLCNIMTAKEVRLVRSYTPFGQKNSQHVGGDRIGIFIWDISFI